MGEGLTRLSVEGSQPRSLRSVIHSTCPKVHTGLYLPPYIREYSNLPLFMARRKLKNNNNNKNLKNTNYHHDSLFNIKISLYLVRHYDMILYFLKRH